MKPPGNDSSGTWRHDSRAHVCPSCGPGPGAIRADLSCACDRCGLVVRLCAHGQRAQVEGERACRCPGMRRDQ